MAATSSPRSISCFLPRHCSDWDWVAFQRCSRALVQRRAEYFFWCISGVEICLRMPRGTAFLRLPKKDIKWRQSHSNTTSCEPGSIHWVADANPCRFRGRSTSSSELRPLQSDCADKVLAPAPFMYTVIPHIFDCWVTSAIPSHSA